MKQAIIGLALMAVVGTSSGDMFQPSHSCSEPIKPFEFDDEWEVQRFRDEVESFRRCINEFVEEQNSEIRKHQIAAEEAIEDWERFVRYEL